MTSKSIDISNRLTRVNGITKSLLIPERTRLLLWITDELPDTDENIVGFSPVTGEAVYHSQVSGINPLHYGDKIPYLISNMGSRVSFGDLAIHKHGDLEDCPLTERGLLRNSDRHSF